MNKLRRILGILGMLLPLVCIGFSAIGFKYYGLEFYIDSISATHYFNSSVLFLSLVMVTSVFLLTYKGLDMTDYWAAKVSGIGGILLVLFPCAPVNPMVAAPWNFMMLSTSITNVIHLIGAASFFLPLAYITVFRFTKTNQKIISGKKALRNIIYKVCGWTMFGSLAAAIALSMILKVPALPLFGWVFIGEAIGLWAFGISWLVKGEAVKQLNDVNVAI